MQVGELYNTDRYGLLLVLSIEPLYMASSGEQVYRVRVLRMDGTGRTTYGEFTHADWERMHSRVSTSNP
jgi:hypothetical protein